MRLSGFLDLFGIVFLINWKFSQLDFLTFSREQFKYKKFLKRFKWLLFLIQSLEIVKILLNTTAAKLLFSLFTTHNKLKVTSFFVSFLKLCKFSFFHKSSRKEVGTSFVLLIHSRNIDGRSMKTFLHKLIQILHFLLAGDF